MSACSYSSFITVFFLCIYDVFMFTTWSKINAVWLPAVVFFPLHSFPVYLPLSLLPSLPVVATILASAGAEKVSLVLLIGRSEIGMCLSDSNDFIRE